MGVYDTWNGIVIDVSALTSDVLNTGDALFFGFVGQHGATNNVADSVDAGNVCLEVIVDFDLAALGHGDSGFLQAQTFGVWPPASTDKNMVGLKNNLVASLNRLNCDFSSIAQILAREHLMANHNLHALLRQNLIQHRRHLQIEAGTDLIQKLHNRNFRAQPRIHRSQLKPDDTTTHHNQFFRDLRQGQGARRANDVLLVEGEVWEGGGLAACGDQDVLGCDGFGLAVVGLDFAGLWGWSTWSPCR